MLTAPSSPSSMSSSRCIERRFFVSELQVLSAFSAGKKKDRIGFYKGFWIKVDVMRWNNTKIMMFVI